MSVLASDIWVEATLLKWAVSAQHPLAPIQFHLESMEYLHFVGGVEERVQELCLSLRRRVEELRDKQRAERVRLRVEELRTRVRERGGLLHALFGTMLTRTAQKQPGTRLRDQGTQTEDFGPRESSGGRLVTAESSLTLEKFWDVSVCLGGSPYRRP